MGCLQMPEWTFLEGNDWAPLQSGLMIIFSFRYCKRIYIVTTYNGLSGTTNSGLQAQPPSREPD